MKKSVIVLCLGLILLIGFASGVYADKVKSSSPSSDSSSSTSGSSSGNSKKDSKTEDKKSSDADSKSSKTGEGGSSTGGLKDSKTDSVDSKTGSKEKSKQVKKTEEIYTFLDENQERLEVQIRTETKTKDGETYQKIKIRGVEAVSDLDLEKENGEEINAKLSNGINKEIKIMPNTASKIALSKLRSQDMTLELKEVGKGDDLKVVYSAEADKTVKFLGLFKIEYNLVAIIDSETGEIIELKGKPWWDFLAGKPLEEEEIQNLSLQLIKPLDDIGILKNSKIRLNLEDYFFNAKEYSISESENLSLILEDSLLTIIPKTNWTGSALFSLIAINGNESLDNLVNVFVTEEDLSVQTIQYGAVVGERVKWKKEFKSEKKEKFKLKLPENSQDITLYRLDENKDLISEEFLEDVNIDLKSEENIYFELEYFTPEPEMHEEVFGNKKKITIQGIDDAHYTDVVAFNYLNIEAKEEEVKLYHLNKNNKKEVIIEKYDLNGNGLIDYIEWVVPQLSNETYELVIEITKADHLDENRIFLSDIYGEVKGLDNIWSELIPNNHYVRVGFESELTSERDITVYARSDTDSSIEVYLKDSNEKIAEITGIQEAGEYKTYLNGLTGSATDFDLKIISSSGIEFDYIVDPATLLIVYPQNVIYNSVVTELNYTISTAQECSYSLDEGVNNVTITCGDNVTGLAANEGSNTWTVYVNSTDTGLWDVSNSVTFTVDTTFPEISITYPANTTYTTDVNSINYTYSESNCNGVWYSVDGGLINSSTVTCGTNFSGLSSIEGSNTWTVYLNDTAGNENSTSITFTKDTVAPTIDIDYPININYNVNVSELNYTSNGINCWYSRDSGVTNSTSVSCTADFTDVISAEGSNTWTVYTNDSSGNENSTSITFFKDTINPQISFGTGTSADNSNLSQSNIYVSVSVTEANEDTITFLLYNSTGQVNSNSFTDSTRTINWTSLDDEIYTYNVTVNDTSGNLNTTLTRTITLDTTNPTISFSCSKTSLTAGETLSCSCSATDNLDSNPTVSYTANPPTANTGTFTTTCSVTDYTGNSDSSSISYTVESVGGGYPNYGISSENLVKGHNRLMHKNWKMNFEVEGERHTMLINDITEDAVFLTLSSEPQEAVLSLAEEKKFELSGDNYYDLLIKLNGVKNKIANLTILSIHEEILEEIVESDEDVVEMELPSIKKLTWFNKLINWFKGLF